MATKLHIEAHFSQRTPDWDLAVTLCPYGDGVFSIHLAENPEDATCKHCLRIYKKDPSQSMHYHTQLAGEPGATRV